MHAMFLLSAAAYPAFNFLVGVPFVTKDIAALKRSWALWHTFPPFTQPNPSNASILYLYNGRCNTKGNRGGNACSQMKELVVGAHHGFRRVLVRDAHLVGLSDTYDKQRRSPSWTAGPNNMFHLLLAQANSLGYSHMLQLESDVLPYRAGWLERAMCIAHMSDAWIIGSSLFSDCTRDDQVRTRA